MEEGEDKGIIAVLPSRLRGNCYKSINVMFNNVTPEKWVSHDRTTPSTRDNHHHTHPRPVSAFIARPTLEGGH